MSVVGYLPQNGHELGPRNADVGKIRERLDASPERSPLPCRPEDMSELFKKKLAEAVMERDDMWRKHEKAQISYLQEQNAQLLSRLHDEIERLQNVNRDLQRRLHVSPGEKEPSESSAELESQLKAEKDTSEQLKESLAKAEKRNAVLAQTLEKTAELYKSQIANHEDRIRQLTRELHDRTLTVTQLSQQLRNFRLREAMAQAQYRRKSSMDGSKMASPTAFRLFGSPSLPSPRERDDPSSSTSQPSQTAKQIHVNIPGGSLLKRSATITVAYPQPRAASSLTSNPLRTSQLTDADGGNGIEKPMKRRTSALSSRPVERRERPELVGRPMAVCQVTGNESGGNEGFLLAISYEARAYGVKRSMSATAARAACPEITLVQAPIMQHIHKVDLARYREASTEVMEALQGLHGMKYAILEQASIDEAFMDISGFVDKFIERKGPLEEICQMMRLAIGAHIVEQLRDLVKKRTGFECSAGVANSKTMAKLVAGLRKPNRQSLLSPKFRSTLFDTIPISSVRNLGGLTGGRVMDAFSIKTMGELAAIPEDQLNARFPGLSQWLRALCHGEDDEVVKPRIGSKTITVSKNFPGKSVLWTREEVQTWCDGLAKELSCRLKDDQAKQKRTAMSLNLSFTNPYDHHTKTIPLLNYDADTISIAMTTFVRLLNRGNERAGMCPVTHIRMSAQKFENRINTATQSITKWFQPAAVGDATQSTSSGAGNGASDDADIVYDDEEYRAHREFSTACIMEEEITRKYEEHEDDEDSRSVLIPDWRECIANPPPNRGDIPCDVWDSIPEEIVEELQRYYDDQEHRVLDEHFGRNSQKSSQKKGVVKKKKKQEGARKRASLLREAQKNRKIDEFFPSQSSSQSQLSPTSSQQS
ncbi:ImpB/MucB/SamB family protein [Aphelenchoides avenae]|nr:ImpB/MucB/SamB family protein [Aphelenchus avenae]